jgi:hypothetical protein
MAFLQRFSIGPLATVTDYVVCRFYTAENPGVQVNIVPFAPPHPSSRVVSVLLDDDVAHICKIYYSPDGIVLGSLKHEWEFQPVNQSVDGRQPIELHVIAPGGTPGEFEIEGDQDEYNNTDLEDADFYPEQRGTGPARDDEWDTITTGGFKVLGGRVFNDGDTWFLHFIPKIRIDSFPSTGQLNDINIVTASEVLDSDYQKKNNYADFATTLAVTTWPALGTLPNQRMTFSTHGGLQRYWTLQLNGGDTTKFLGQSVNSIELGKGEFLEVMIKGGILYVLNYAGDAHRVGERFWGDKLEINSIFRDGTEYDQADYPRLVKWIKSLPIGQVLNYTDWELTQTVNGVVHFKNKSKFAIDDTAGTFRVPDDRNRFVRALQFLDATVDAERLTQGPGGYQADAIKVLADVKGVKITGNNTIGPAASPLDSINSTGGEFDLLHVFDIGDGAETRGENYGQYPLLRI